MHGVGADSLVDHGVDEIDKTVVQFRRDDGVHVCDGVACGESQFGETHVVVRVILEEVDEGVVAQQQIAGFSQTTSQSKSTRQHLYRRENTRIQRRRNAILYVMERYKTNRNKDDTKATAMIVIAVWSHV